jgi:hypothetical protein
MSRFLHHLTSIQKKLSFEKSLIFVCSCAVIWWYISVTPSDQGLMYALQPFDIRMQSFGHLAVHFGKVFGSHDDDQCLAHAL